MKRFFLLLATMVVSLPLLFYNVNASPADSCLKMALPNDYREEWDAEMNRYDWVGSINDDSVRIDSCIDSPTFGERYGKRYFVLKFDIYPFDSLLKVSELVSVDKITNKITGLKDDLLRLQQAIGTIYLTKQPHEYWQSDEYLYNNGWIALLLENYQNIDSVLNLLKTEIHDVQIVGFEATVKTPLGGGGDIEESSLKKEFKVYPNPANNTVLIERNGVEAADLQIVDITGRICLSHSIQFGETQIQIDISKLPAGKYIIEINNETGSLIVE
jgi:hypothetical protein